MKARPLNWAISRKIVEGRTCAFIAGFVATAEEAAKRAKRPSLPGAGGAFRTGPKCTVIPLDPYQAYDRKPGTGPSTSRRDPLTCEAENTGGGSHVDLGQESRRERCA